MIRRLAQSLALAVALFMLSTAAARAQSPSGTPHSATIKWTAPSPVGGSGTVKCYNLYRSPVPVSAYVVIQPCITGTQATDATGTNGQQYSWEVTTVDTANNESVGSAPIQGTIPSNPNPPTAPTITLAQLTTNPDGTETALVKFTDAPNQDETVLFYDGNHKLRGQKIVVGSSVTSFAQTLTVPSGTDITVSVCNLVCSSQQAM